MDATLLADTFEQLRPELLSFLTRLVVRASVAEELVQETALRALQHREDVPSSPDEMRPWLFRVAGNLGIDYRRRRGTVREGLMADARRAAESSPEFSTKCLSLRGSPETKAIAREHLVACFACTMGRLPAQHAAALLLREVYGFGNAEAAAILDAREAQVKNWLQAARASMAERYAGTCALVGKQGVCYQCVELDDHFAAGAGDPLAGTEGRLDDRLRVVREMRASAPGTWSRMLAGLLDEVG